MSLPDDLPPTQKGRHHEIRARGLREFAGLTRDDQPLDPFALARFANLMVATFDQIEPFLTPETKADLIGDGKNSWSGGAASHALPDGTKLIILNPTHPPTRQRATLMEEVCHVFLGHKPSRLAIENKTKDGKIIARDYNHADRGRGIFDRNSRPCSIYSGQTNGSRREDHPRNRKTFRGQPGVGRV
ncbi:MAG: ImmA/IrrE family metallo-endopeptidase [Pyrinomonadaceae bacterium]